MQKRTVTWLIIVISAALLGLVLVQAKLTRDTVALKQVQFNENVDNALVAVSDRLERAEARQQLQGLPGEDVGKALFGAGGADASTFSDEGTEQSLEQLLRGILSANMLRDIGERIDPPLLDSLLREELSLRHIRCNYQYGVFDEKGAMLIGGLGAQPNAAQLLESPHAVRLFRNDWGMGDLGYEPSWWLRLYVPQRAAVITRSMWPMLVSTALFVLIIAGVFGHTIRTIFKQKRLNDIKNDLVNNLTHELKTPISTISLACEAITDPGMPKGPEEIELYTNMIREENKRLGLLVENVLLSAVSEEGNMDLRMGDVDMHALLAEVVRNSELQVKKRDGTITLQDDAELAHVRGDRTYLTSVFYNLIDNAVKYCSEAPVINVITRSDARSLIIEVADNGIGIERGEQKKIFDRLYRIPTGNVHNVKGFGLGLSYVKGVIMRHGGTIRVESNTSTVNGSGSRFIITLPFEQDEEKK